MPVDEAGNRAEMIVSSNSTIQRSNWGRAFKPYFSAAARDLTKRLRSFLNVTEKVTEEQLEVMDQSLVTQAYNELLRYYAIVSPHSFWYYCHQLKDEEKRRKHLVSCLRTTVRNFMPVDNPVSDIDAVLHLEKHFPQTYGPVVYKTLSGKFEKTVSKVRVAPMYMMLLEKIADDGSSASIGKLQHHGLLASQTKSEKYGLPYRSNHTRNTGESEGRLYLFYSRSIISIAEMIDRSNNPETMRSISRTLLTTGMPTNVPVLVDRNTIPYGNTRPIQFLQHFMSTQGAWIDYIPEEEAFNLGMTEPFDAR